MSDNVVQLAAQREAIIDARWCAYVAAARHAQASLKVEDGVAAGRAWRAWLDLFMAGDQRAKLSAGPGHLR